ncbi:MAG: hypothetical protein HGB11_11955 [Chlorobiales bacterium]|nr:hypothetical protein [Chlorobiales bacterium]
MRPIFLLILTATFLGLFACSEDKSINESAGTPPSVLSLDSIRLGDSAIAELNLDQHISSGTLSNFSLNLQSVIVKGTSGNPSLTAILYAPGSGEEVAISQLLKVSAQGDTLTFKGSLSVSLDRTDVGNYTVAAVAQDDAGQAGASVRTKIRFYKNNLSPELVAVTFSIDTIDVTVPPYADTLIVSAVPNDPDGRSDIAAVEVLVGASPFPMYDDGNFKDHGDRFIGDGIYSRGFSINSANTTGQRTLRFRVIDKSGEVSNEIVKTFYIKSPK